MGVLLKRFPPTKRELLLLALIMIVAFLLRLAFLHEPFQRDEGWYATIAQEILHGGIPYRDAIDQKPPGVFYIYAVAIAFCGATTESIRTFTAIYTLFTLGSIYLLTRYLRGATAGLLAAGLFAVYSCSQWIEGSSSNSEVFLVLPLVLSVLCFVYGHDRQDWRPLVASGFLAGLAMLVKTVALPYVLLLTIFAYFYSAKPVSSRQGLGNVVLFLLPSVFLAVAVIGYFYFNSALEDFIFWNFTVPLKYSKGAVGVTGPSIMVTLKNLSNVLPLPLLLSVGTSIWLLFKKRSLNMVLVVLLLPASCAAALLPGMNFLHYFIQVVPFMSILGGIGLARLFERKGMLLLGSLPVFVLLFAHYVKMNMVFYKDLSPKAVSIYKYGPDFVNSVAIANYIRERTDPNDYIFQWGFEPELYFLSGRRSPLPYISSTILKVLDDRDRAVMNMLQTLITKKPKYIVYQSAWADNPGVLSIQQLLARDYVQETTIGYGQIFRLKSI